MNVNELKETLIVVISGELNCPNDMQCLYISLGQIIADLGFSPVDDRK